MIISILTLTYVSVMTTTMPMLWFFKTMIFFPTTDEFTDCASRLTRWLQKHTKRKEKRTSWLNYGMCIYDTQVPFWYICVATSYQNDKSLEPQFSMPTTSQLKIICSCYFPNINVFVLNEFLRVFLINIAYPYFPSASDVLSCSQYMEPQLWNQI